MIIKDQRNGKSNEQDRQQLAALLFKLGYTVRIIKTVEGKKSVIGVEAIGDDNN